MWFFVCGCACARAWVCRCVGGGQSCGGLGLVQRWGGPAGSLKFLVVLASPGVFSFKIVAVSEGPGPFKILV